MPSPNIEWLTRDDIWEGIAFLQAEYREDPIRVINFGPIEYILNLEGLAYLYGDDPLRIASAKIRTIIKGHPLLDGNKRLGMFLGNYFPELNGIALTADDESFFEVAIGLACGDFDIEGLHGWLAGNTAPAQNP